MNEQEFELVKEVSKELVKDVYNDGIKNSVVEAGEILESVVGLFNNIVFYPVKKANIYYKNKLENFKNDLENRMKDIPKDKLTEPDLMIAGPALEALKYTYDKEELRNMFLNLLASSMNKDNRDDTHPGYVEIIKQLTPLDAKVFKIIHAKGQVGCVHPILRIDNSIKVYINAYPNYLVEEILDGSNLYEGNNITTTIDTNNGVIKLNDFGKKFANVCL